ncbi:MAG: bifunctional methylenetetrahydrofolate dehydrogenase/methenyltetrahydrofolate cyclohydrolase FolD [Rhodospirillales bacterium]|nr:bifunctional methylenetetrahydrofolate dehydrogenase/methenyltetrahydrofolate cyclohydrolase FolD [Alphaproteobacteria bacterium]MCB1840071.1 bifunctional methylenetetrahydrofolate dehydrogenase/methenyltetrahydrofolate cyclohydrolase FolD [Alphaproteobacteria bacterium]MCB9976313.1 bifunctional methylenetetrahydrofolate dehydrogenase/methenyltetrahydrofolate cyclohydrolase FolD [Rhodospirillales bacterium]
MSAKIIDGKAMATAIRMKLGADVSGFKEKPGLAVILVGDDPASQIYVRNKIKACESVGIKSFESRLPGQVTEAEVAAEIKAFNDNPTVHGILLQLPLPAHLNSHRLTQAIAPEKDVDGLTVTNAGKLFLGMDDGLIPCTPQGSMILIRSFVRELAGLNAVVIGRSNLFGKPMAQLLLRENCTVTTAHSRTKNLDDVCAQADILVAAVGRPRLVKQDWIKRGACVIDVGINRDADGKLCGDVDYEGALSVAGAITPVPGGVGPMTIACLLSNTVKAYQFKRASGSQAA